MGIRLQAVFLVIIVWFMPISAFSQENQAWQAAQNFLSYINSPRTIASMESIQGNHLDSNQPALHCGWVFHLNGGGYMVMPSSGNRFPVKAYSPANDYRLLPSPYRNFVEKELELYARMDQETAQGYRTVQTVGEEDQAAHAAWEFLLNWRPENRTRQAYVPDTVLLNTTWNQGYPYNKFLPEIDGQKVLAGCVNVAQAQVMKFHAYPEKGRGISAYMWHDQTLQTILHHPYYWENMPDSIGMATDAYLQDEAAILIRDLGVINKTAFGTDASSASINIDGFIRHFGYSDTLSRMDNTHLDTFFSTLRSQIDSGLPVLLSFPGHMVVVDGYASDKTGRKFHINMGWGGSDDNYYYLDEPVHTSGYVFSPDLDIIFNIKPCIGIDCVLPDAQTDDDAPIFMTNFTDVVMSADNFRPLKMRIDARSGNGDDVALAVKLSRQDTVSAVLKNDILTIQALADGRNKAVKVRLTAAAGGREVMEDFVVLVSDQDIFFGADQVLSGRFDSQEGVYTHPVILEGPCEIFVDRGYANQAFYVWVEDTDGNWLAGDADGTQELAVPAVDQAFDFGLYAIAVSLRARSANWQYPLDEKADYMIRINAPGASAETGQIAGFLGIDFPDLWFRVPGDITGDGQVTLSDKIVILKILTGLTDTAPDADYEDVNEDGRVGIHEALFWP